MRHRPPPPNDDPQALGYPGYCDRGSATMAGKLDPECSHRWFNRTATARKYIAVTRAHRAKQMTLDFEPGLRLAQSKEERLAAACFACTSSAVTISKPRMEKSRALAPDQIDLVSQSEAHQYVRLLIATATQSSLLAAAIASSTETVRLNLVRAARNTGLPYSPAATLALCPLGAGIVTRHSNKRSAYTKPIRLTASLSK